jgi:outer membrane protein assembly factor BamE (lipoprotein component of BamABCDE complex)
MSFSRKVVVTVVLVILVALGGYVLWGAYRMNHPPVPKDKISQLRVGLAQDEVIQILGEPTSRSEGGKYWIYSRPHLWNALHLFFDEEGRLEMYELDD